MQLWGGERGVRWRAAPGPVERRGDDPGRDRVPDDVAIRPDEVAVVLDPAGERMRAEEMRRASVPEVVYAREASVQLLQAARDPVVGRVDEQVVVVGHQDVRDHAEAERGKRQLEQVEEDVAICVVEKEVPVVAAVCRDVIDAVGVHTGRPAHLAHGRAARPGLGPRARRCCTFGTKDN